VRRENLPDAEGQVRLRVINAIRHQALRGKDLFPAEGAGSRARAVFCFLALCWVGALLQPAGLSAQKQRILHSIEEIYGLDAAQAAQGYPVELHVTVLYSDPEWGMLQMQDETGHMFLEVAHDSPAYNPGTRLLIRAVTRPRGGKDPIERAQISVLGPGPLPPALNRSVQELDSGNLSAHLVSTEGVLRPCSRNWYRVCYQIREGKRALWVFVPAPEDAASRALLGARVKVRGTIGAANDPAIAESHAQLFVTSLKEFQVESAARSFLAPADIGTLYSSLTDQRFTQPALVRGVVLWSEPGRLFLKDFSGALIVNLTRNDFYAPGKTLDLTGYPTRGEFGLELSDALVSSESSTLDLAGLNPAPAAAAQLMQQRRSGQRVTLKGRLIEQRNEGGRSTFQLEDGRARFLAVLARGDGSQQLMNLAGGEELEVTGVELMRSGNAPWSGTLLLLMETPADIRVVGGGAWLTPQRILVLAGILLFCIAAPLIWVTQLRRTVNRQTGIIRAQMENELQLESKYRRLFERNLASVFTWRSDGVIVDCNMAFARLLGFHAREDIIGRSYWEFVADPERRKQLDAALEQGAVSNCDASLLRDDLSTVHLLKNITPVQTSEGVVYETTAIDVTRLRQNESELQRARDVAVLESLRDPLTSLPNRRMLIESLGQILARARAHKGNVVILYVDLDGFKLVNDSLGHAIGDQLLVQVAEAMQLRIGNRDLLGRLGGDEFMAILSHPDSCRSSNQLADSLLAVASQPFYVQGHKLMIGASIGVSCFPEDASEAEELMQQADRAMYAAKREGKNRIMHYSPELGTEVRERLKLENHLRSAIERGEISLVYQPEFDALSHRIIRFEALARWNHPALGAIPPSRFIPIAEESGQIGKLGAFILEQACREAVSWQTAARQPVQVAVNVSSMQFRQQGFVDEVRSVLERTGLSPDLLQLELTESIMLNNPGTTQTMNELRRLGISLAIDDFGTGYSNLSYLPSLPFDSLKIDGSFLSNIQEPHESESMIRTLTELAHNFGMKVIAEGVETPEQLEMIRSLGVNELQGFLMGRPTEAPLLAFLQWIAEQGGVEEAFSPEAPIPERAN
jgi:diguanylate cyclase (GGDEF)-like protein/PAS domain S-box-containing protein